MERDAEYMRFAWRVLGELGSIILFPALLALFAARTLETSGGSRAQILAIIAAAFLLTAAALVLRIRAFGREYRRLNKTPRL